ncbi:hypothetical protein [Engelhardtia mirabilis]|uniref:Uncharacterized protein n=1 Tax=Engelhardtia mirabilis TaxID=2528011 RepID=A0A518BGR1_9BACT|nr:hypothetical protein Pla133_12440 [Planctomycetes bacterium Pla133]QDV00505.1 hypothetical protein Pla86_12440 [Planctomycetes bacterium Pla86]
MTSTLLMRPSSLRLLAPALLAAPALAGQGWVATFGGAGFDSVEEVAATPDGAFVAVGNTTSFDPSGDVWIARVGAGGSAAWERILGGAGADSVQSMVPTADGGALLVGSTASFGSGGWIVKVSSAGSIAWQRTYKGTKQFNAVEHSPNGYYVAGSMDQNGVYNDACVLEIDPTGALLWQKRLAGDAEDVAACLAASDDGVLVSIQSSSGFPGSPKVDPVPFTRPWLVKLDPAGDVLWQRVYNMSGGDVINDIVATDDGGYVAVGEILAMAFFQGDSWTMRLDAAGDLLWDLRAGDSFSLALDQGSQVVATQDGGFVVAGSTATAGAGGEDFWLLGFDAGGTLVWNTTLGNTGFDRGQAIATAPDGDLIVGGYAQGFASASIDGLMMRVSPTGQLDAGCQLAGGATPNEWTSQLSIGVPAVTPSNLALVPTSPLGGTLPIDTWSFLCAPQAAVEGLGCGVNPAGSLAVSGTPDLGGSFSIELDNPLGTQTAGSLPLLALSAAPAVAGSSCGIQVPGFGMAGPGAVGELLVALPSFQTLPGTPWGGAGSPSTVALSVPNDSALLGISIFAQGVLIDAVGPVTIGLTEGAELQLGN